ncbi:hypothetical protein MKW98_006323 [Papaver atlanticum]|uniref:non-specific serine/threonine protein kinase n=1 Tax=Papaver atlanticum TaxID=357466 RepID=A0AAD4TE67_9MAGN|nr:hypothetical protein MKW98_006323 [Papaver atlanticum]
MVNPRVGIQGNEFKIGRRIGSGSFGQIYLGTDIQTNEEVAIKLENAKAKYPQLLYESALYRVFRGGTGIPNARWSGEEGDYKVLVMDLLGPSLEDLFNSCGRKFSLETVLMLAEQMINRVEFIHSKSYLHRDIKPDNFLMGTGGRANQVYIIDFGLAKKYRNSKTRQHAPYREKKDLIGSPRYASRNSHLGIEQSRRDDIESLGYTLMYFLRGSLPWQGLRAVTDKKKNEIIREKMLSTSVEDLCKGYPMEFAFYFHHCRSLRFDAKPDYAYLRRLFRELYVTEGFQFDLAYDWTNLVYQQSPMVTPPSRTPVSDSVLQWFPLDILPLYLSSSNLLGKTSGSASRPAISSSRDARIGLKSTDPSHLRTTEASPGAFRRVTDAQRCSPIGSVETPKNTSSHKTSLNVKNYESVLKGIESLHVDKDEKDMDPY